MQIALVHVSDTGGGAERSVLTLHKSFLELGHESSLYVANKSTDVKNVFRIPHRRAFPGILRVTKYLESDWGLQNLYAPSFRNLDAEIGDVDVVHLHSLWSQRDSFADLAGIVKLASRYPTVMTLRDGWMLTGHCACPIGCNKWQTGCGNCPDLNRAPRIERDSTATNWRRKRRAIQAARLHITTVSSWLQREVEASPVFSGKPVTTVHNSVDGEDFVPGDSTIARRQLGIPEDAFVVLLAGQSIEGIHQGIAQHAVAALNSLADPSICPLLIGRSAGAVAATLKTDSIQLPFRESPAEMAECYRAADVTIVPSEYETFGRVAAESIFCGTPVIAFATGGLTDIVADGVNGRLVPTGDIARLADAIFSAKNDKADLLRMRNSCVKSVREKFDTQKIAMDYLSVYRKTISEFKEIESFRNR